MKKAALTFGLFSLVMVATSFATPQTNSSLTIDNGNYSGIDDGAMTGGKKKLDFHTNGIDDGAMTGGKKKLDFQARNNMSMQNDQLNSVNQSLGKNIKLD